MDRMPQFTGMRFLLLDDERGKPRPFIPPPTLDAADGPGVGPAWAAPRDHVLYGDGSGVDLPVRSRGLSGKIRPSDSRRIPSAAARVCCRDRGRYNRRV